MFASFMVFSLFVQFNEVFLKKNERMSEDIFLEQNNIVPSLLPIFEKALKTYEKKYKKTIVMIGTDAFSDIESKSYSNSYFDYGMAFKINIDIGESTIKIDSDPMEWLESGIVEHLEKYGIFWMYKKTKLQEDVTSFYYPEFQIEYLKVKVYYFLKRTSSANTDIIINPKNIIINKKRQIRYGNKF